MNKFTETQIVKRVQNASDGEYTYIVRDIAGKAYNRGVTYIYSEDILKNYLGYDVFDYLNENMPELDGQPDNLKAFKVTTTIEEVPVSELFTPVGAEEEK